MSAKLTLDLQPVFNSDREFDLAIRAIIFEATRTGTALIEIISGGGSGQRRVMALLQQAHIRQLYGRVEEDTSDRGRIVLHLTS